VVFVVDTDKVVVVVAVGMTIPILGACGGLKVVLLLPVLIHLWMIKARRELDHG
jgi:hypothetical protein